MTADGHLNVRELDCRWTGGIQVRLLWCQPSGRVLVAVKDSGESFRVDVPDGVHPLDVFHHPFAYAAHGRADHEFENERELAGRASRHDTRPRASR